MIYIIYMRNIPYDAPGLQPRRPSPFALTPFVPRLSPRPAAAHYFISVRFPITAPPSPAVRPPAVRPSPFTTSRRPPPSRCRPLSYPLSASLSQPRRPSPFVPRLSLRPAAARLRPVAANRLISVRFPITVPPPATPNAVRRSDLSHAFRGPFCPLRHAQALPRRPTVVPSLARKISLPSCGGRGDCCMMNMVQFAPKHGTGA